MKNKRKMQGKTRFILQAARTSVEVIERNGFKCILVGPIAEYLHGSRTLPQDVSLVALPNSDGRPTPEIIAEILQNSHPFHFRDVLHQGATSHLRYYDSSASEREHFCMIHLLRVEHTSPIHIVRLKNLPTAAPLIHVLIDHLHTMSSPTSLESLGKSSGCAEAPSTQVITLNNRLLAEKERTLPASSDTVFNPETTSVLDRASHHSPHFSSLSKIATPAIDPPAESLSDSTSLPTTTESAHLAFINSLDEFDSGPEDVQLHQPNPNSSADIDPRIQTICRITKKVVNLLHDLNIHCALFGSVACWLYGNTRVPDDIDLLVFPPPDMPREHLKQILQQTHPRLRLERPANPDAPFKILYFHLDGTITSPRGFFPQNKCKIDVLIPGILHLPNLLSRPPHQIPHLGGLPVIPFALLLLQKLQAWDDHRKLRWSSYPKKYAKATIDARDLQQLLTLDEHVVPLRVSQPWNNNNNNDSALFTEEFMILSRERVRDFCESFPACKRDFELLGLFFS